jgi:sugar phosphate isomerase/epimerase
MNTIPSLENNLLTATLPRRDWLKATAAVLLGARALGAAAEERQAPEMKNLKLGVMSNVYAHLPLEKAVAKIKAEGFCCVVTDFAFADARFDPLKPDWRAVEKVCNCLDRHGIRIVGLYGYTNIVDPNPARRQRGLAKTESLLANVKRLGCTNVSTETGTLNPTSEWLISPENATEEGYQKCRAAIEKLVRQAEKTGATVSIEPYWQNVIDSIDRAERLLRDVDSPSLRLVMDPCNYYRKQDLPNTSAMLKEMFKRLGDKIVIAHAKDVKASANGTDLPASGRGDLDYPLYLRLLIELEREMPLLIEHVTWEDVPRARDYVLAQLKKV